MENDIVRKQVNEAIASGKYVWFVNSFELTYTQKICFFTGKWHRNFFTNRDAVELLTAITEKGLEDPRGKLHSIMTSRCKTKMTKYALFEKVTRVKSQIMPRQSRRRRSASSSMDTSGDLLCLRDTIHIFILSFVLLLRRHRYSKPALQDSNSKSKTSVANIGNKCEHICVEHRIIEKGKEKDQCFLDAVSR